MSKQFFGIGLAIAAVQMLVSVEVATAQLQTQNTGALGNQAFAGQTGLQTGVFAQQGTAGASGFGTGFEAAGLGGGLLNSGQQVGAAAGAAQPVQQGFVGRDAADRRAIYEAMSQAQGGRLNTNTNFESLTDLREQAGGAQNTNQEPSPALVRLIPAFTVSSPILAGASAPVVQSRLIETMSAAGHAAPRVLMEGRTATLLGTVSTEHQKRLAEKLVSIEPGVSEVNNQLSVDSTGDGS